MCIENLNIKRLHKKTTICILLIIYFIFNICISFAEAIINPVSKDFSGIPKVTIEVSNLDDSGNLIYCGVDIAVFYDPEKDGTFVVIPDDKKVKRFITRSTNISIDLGKTNSYKKGIPYKLAMRTLYVPVGKEQEPIIIADFNNGNEGWTEIPGTLFIPTYFINAEDNPYIQHTTKWEKNRVEYNESKVKVFRKESAREQSTFWSGEKFIINVETSEPVSSVAISIVGEKDNSNKEFKTILKDYKENQKVSDGAIYTGELWDANMFNKWGNYIPKKLDMKMQIIDNEGDVAEEKIIPIIIDNRELYYRSRREF